jgi:hypothetical protein
MILTTNLKSYIIVNRKDNAFNNFLTDGIERAMKGARDEKEEYFYGFAGGGSRVEPDARRMRRRR